MRIIMSAQAELLQRRVRLTGLPIGRRLTMPMTLGLPAGRHATMRMKLGHHILHAQRVQCAISSRCRD